MKIYRVAITGVESTGKSTLAEILGAFYESQCLSEYARIYLSRLDKPYGRMDVLRIAQQQIMRQGTMDMLINTLEKAGQELEKDVPFFYDTELTVIKIWYETRYQKPVPAYLQNAYEQQEFDLYLLPYPDLAWEEDPLREHQALTARMELFEQYEHELQKMKRPYQIIKGQGKERTEQAIEAVENLFQQVELAR